VLQALALAEAAVGATVQPYPHPGLEQLAVVEQRRLEVRRAFGSLPAAAQSGDLAGADLSFVA